MIDFACPECARKIKVQDDRAGRKGKCPQCGKSLTIPTPSAALAETATFPHPPAPAEDATVPPKEGAAAEGPRDTHADADATGGVRGVPSSELTDFLAPPQSPGEIGRLGPYRVLKILGAGGMGVVFQAEDPSLQRLVALKAMLPTLAASASARERFLREARSAAAVEHDHIVAIYQVGEDRSVPFLAMPFLKGEPLDARLKRDRRLPPAEVLRIARETAAGLEAARQRGMIHRDIKPANLWLEEGTGRVKVLDFGLARARGDEAHLTQQGAIIGTPAYMAPEQAGGKTDHRADLFSLGCVMYRMATGELPFKGVDTISTLMAVATEPPRPPAEINPRLPAALCDLILRLLAKKPDERPASAQAVIEAIRAIEAAPKAKGKPGPAAVVPGRSGPQRLGVIPARPKSIPAPARRRKLAPPPRGAGGSPALVAGEPPAPRGGGALVFGLLALLLLAGLGVGAYFLWPHLPFNSSTSPSTNPVPQTAKKPSDPPVVQNPPDESWQPLFDGESLKGWTTINKKEENNWSVEHGLLYTHGLDKSWLMTEKQYGDFEVRLEYKATVKAKSGVALRAPLEWDPSYKGMEIQILDDTFQKGDRKVEIKPLDTMGSIWDVAPAYRPAPRPAGEWNHLDIYVQGREVVVELNGKHVLDADLDLYVKDKGATHPGILKTNTRGRLGLQSLLGRVEFKKIEVRRLSSDKEGPKAP